MMFVYTITCAKPQALNPYVEAPIYVNLKLIFSDMRTEVPHMPSWIWVQMATQATPEEIAALHNKATVSALVAAVTVGQKC